MVTLYVPACVTSKVASVCPFISVPLRNHVYEVPPVAVSVVEPPVHIEVLAGDIDPVGAEETVTEDVFDAVPSQPP